MIFPFGLSLQRTDSFPLYMHGAGFSKMDWQKFGRPSLIQSYLPCPSFGSKLPYLLPFSMPFPVLIVSKKIEQETVKNISQFFLFGRAFLDLFFAAILVERCLSGRSVQLVSGCACFGHFKLWPWKYLQEKTNISIPKWYNHMTYFFFFTWFVCYYQWGRKFHHIHTVD